MAVNDLYLCKIQGRVASQITFNTFYYLETVTGPGGPDPRELLNAQFDITLSPPFRGCCSADWLEQTVTTQKVRPVPMSEAFIFTYAGSGSPGLRAAGACPPQIAAVITRRTGLAGRANRGRLFVPAVPEGDQTDGVLLTSYMTSLNALGAVMNDNLISSGYTWVPVIWSRFLNKVARDARIPITTHTARSTCYTQRRRTVGVGV